MPRRRKPAIFTGVLVLALCGMCTIKARSQSAVATPDTFAFAFPTGNTSTFLAYIAEGIGEFKKLGVTVTIHDRLGTNANAYVVSGQADSTFSGTGTPLLVAAQGKPTSVFYAFGGGGLSGALMGVSGKSDTVGKLKADPNCRIAGFSPGTSGAGNQNIFKRSAALDNCQFVAYPTVAAQIGAVVSGQVDAAMGNYTSFASAVAEGKLTVIVNPSDPEQAKKYYGDDYIESLFWGLSSRLQEKRSAVAKVIKGMDSAARWLEGKSDADAAAILYSFDNFKTYQLADLVTNMKYSRAFLWRGSTRGYITGEQWDRSLKGVGEWGIPNYDSKNPAFVYDQRVDMSYYRAALGTAK